LDDVAGNSCLSLRRGAHRRAGPGRAPGGEDSGALRAGAAAGEGRQPRVARQAGGAGAPGALHGRRGGGCPRRSRLTSTWLFPRSVPVYPYTPVASSFLAWPRRSLLSARVTSVAISQVEVEALRHGGGGGGRPHGRQRRGVRRVQRGNYSARARARPAHRCSHHKDSDDVQRVSGRGVGVHGAAAGREHGTAGCRAWRILLATS